MTDPPGEALVEVLAGTDADRRRLGGKGAWLDRLVAGGFAVPPAAVLTTAAYREVAAQPSIAALVADLAAHPPALDGDHEAASRAVDEAFLAVDLPDAVRQAIDVAAAATTGGPGDRLAVRSSATAEDDASASFAGQYRSVLDVHAGDELERAVRLVWASLWHPAPRAYRHHHGIDESRLAMAAVVMRMVPARTAGVVFTLDPEGDPATGPGASPDHPVTETVRVEMVEGLGESLVSGQRTPTVHRVPRASAERGGEPGDDPDALAVAVARVALDVEASLGSGPEDVEWAWDGGKLWVLQARPITTAAPPPVHDGFDTPAGDRHWTTAGIAEMLPGVLAPLVWQTAGPALDHAFRATFDLLGAELPPLGPGLELVGRVRGRAVLDLDVLGGVLGSLSAGAAGEIERQYFGSPASPAGADAGVDAEAGGVAPATPAPPGRRRPRPIEGVARDWRAARARRHAVLESEIVAAAVDRLVAAPAQLDAHTDAELAALRARLLDLGGRAFTAEVLVATLAAQAYRSFEGALARRLGDERARRWAQRLTATGRHTRRPAGASMSVFAGPTWAENGLATPGAHDATDALAHHVRLATTDAWRELVHELHALPGWRRTRILTGQIIDVRVQALARQASEAAELLERRERAKGAVLDLGGVLREVHLEIGRRWVEAGRLERSTDVDLLADAEVRGLVPPPSPATLMRRRRAAARDAAAGLLPERFVGRPAAEATVPPPPTGDVLEGWAAGPGRYRGVARVIDDPSRSAELAAGDVLVAEATDASWSPLFLRAGAIVVERGGPLSHAAIVARELGIPAVVNATGARAWLRGPGAGEAAVLVDVDGDHGTVARVEEA